MDLNSFAKQALVDWLPGVGAKSIPVAAAHPWENGYIEAFHSGLTRRVPGEGGIRDGSGRSGERQIVALRYYNAVPAARGSFKTRQHPKEFSSSCDDRENRPLVLSCLKLTKACTIAQRTPISE